MATTAEQLSGQTIFVRYVAIAVGSSAANLLTQWLVSHQWPGAVLMVSILAGTAVGFVIKFALDKLYIFNDSYTGAAREARKVFLYGATAVLTTLLFWSVEALFWYLSYIEWVKYLGAAIGLALGNFAKYHLDRRLAFGPANA